MGPKYIGTFDFFGEGLAVYRDEGGGLFAIDASYVEQDVGPTYNPLSGAEFSPDAAELKGECSSERSRSW